MGDLGAITITAGESNTASNVGTNGTGLFKQKTGVNLEFKKLNVISSVLQIIDDVANSEVDLDIPASAITYQKIQNVSAASRILGRITAGAGIIEELTGTQLTTLLDVFTSALKGLVPLSGGGTTNFLRADGTWAAPPSGAPSGSAGGDLAGSTYPNPVVANDVITNAKLANATANTIKGNATAATADPTDITIGTNTVLGRVAANIVAAALVTAQITDNNVTYAKLQDVTATARLLGRITAGSGDPEELTGTQATTLIDPFTSSLKGVAPASGGGTTNFLRADGTWNAPPGAGIGGRHAPRMTVENDAGTITAYDDDGTTVLSGSNATTVIMAAINALTAGRTWKERVFLKGNFTVTQLTLPSYIILDFTEARLFQANATNIHMLVNNDLTNGNSNIEIVGSILDQNRAGQTVTGANYTSRNSIHMEKVTNLYVHDTQFLNPLACAVLAKDCNNVWIDRNYVTNAYQLGFYLWSPTLGTGNHAWITNNRTYDLRENCIGIQGYNDVWVDKNDLELTGTVPINTQGTNLHILNNKVKTCNRSGISLCAEGTHIGDYSEIVNNHVENAESNDTTQLGLTNQAGAGIHVGISDAADWVIVKDNRVFGGANQSNVAFGMRCEHSQYMQVLNNRVKGWNRNGITIAGVNVTFSGSGRVASQDRALVEGNIVVGNGLINDATVAFRGGISLYGQGSETDYLTNIMVPDNICFNNIDYGIRFKNCKNVYIEDNFLSGNTVGALLNGGSTSGIIRIRNNDGYVTEGKGNSVQSGTGAL